MKKLSLMPNEKEIVWLYDPAIFPRVAEARLSMGTRTRPITLPNYLSRVVVGYSISRPDALGWHRRFRRRVFFVQAVDIEDECDEAFRIDPLTVVPDFAGEETDRCFESATPEQREKFQAIMAAHFAKIKGKRAQAATRQRKHREPQKARAAHNAKRRARYKKKKR